MALWKSRALELEEAAELLREKEAEACYDIIQSWQSKTPIMTPIVELPSIAAKVDDKPFGYNYSHLPSRFPERHFRWSEI